MLNKSQLSAVTPKIMAIPGMNLEHDAGFQLDESPARELHRTHFRFTSFAGAADDHNGNTFVKYLREKGVQAEQRRPKLVVVESAELIRIFG